MIRLTDGKRVVEISMMTWTGFGWSPCWAADFFVVGTLEENEDLEAFEVQDLDYCLNEAQDWENGIGDYDTPEDISKRCVIFDFVEV